MNRYPFLLWHMMPPQRAHDMIITSVLRQNDVVTSLRHVSAGILLLLTNAPVLSLFISTVNRKWNPFLFFFRQINFANFRQRTPVVG